MAQKDKSKKTYRMAEPVRSALQSILRSKIRTKSQRENIAKFLDVAPQTVNNALYEGKGGFDLLISILVIVYKMENVTPDQISGVLKAYLRRDYPLTPTDEMKNELDKWMSQEEQLNWFKMGRAMKQLELSIMGKKKSD